MLAYIGVALIIIGLLIPAIEYAAKGRRPNFFLAGCIVGIGILILRYGVY